MHNRKEIEKTLSNVKASLAVEGLTASIEAIDITRRYLAGECTSQQAVMAIKLIYLI
jgi:hypothetical protein